MKPKAVYIHIPFCSHKCHYCDFTAYVVGGQPVDEYLEALEREMAYTVAEVQPEKIHSIFIGGGTPTVLEPKQLERLLAAVRRHFPHWADDIEFTVEANPGTTEPDKLRVMREGGVNRLSFGAQTFRKDLLEKIGRIHSVEDIRRSVHQAREAGVENISLDLMFGLPEQQVVDVEAAIREALLLQPDHFSVYSLKVEEGTLFHARMLQGKLPLPSEDDELAMYQLTRQQLAEAGYPQYEISNFAKPGFKSRHNSTYWRNEPYYGLGAGAHGYMQGVRHQNVRGVKEYIRLTSEQGRPVDETHTVPLEEEMENQMILGLRLMEGVDVSRFAQRFEREVGDVFGGVLERLETKGLIQWEKGRIRLTEQGILFGNEVFASFIGEAVL
ncbi:oxygen-independent coproporphyrinogen-III oxidase-like protein YqeR [Marinithermofilum abyssi]|uniref:Heme chaperone HemW n=1 Tax=Marinithermofilum abyssi TaxID=1571185 RepID=A0A8J2VG71_9BACL|nr:radical SAM family heme chaperone HemW [Marinithermofilum abyssi]GGE14475.1 oxygen-independent coproporphyrinogen-III oxidase-like protein YqeR [Marinithermofilum abyssi]